MIYQIPVDRQAAARQRFNTARRGLRVVDFKGLPIKVEIEAGDTKSGIDEGGKSWSHTYKVPYGEIPSSRALSDGDGVDVYLGDNLAADLVYVVHQRKMDGSYDEDKCMLGFSSAGEAVLAYKQHGPPWGFGSMDVMTFDQFRNGYLACNRKF